MAKPWEAIVGAVTGFGGAVLVLGALVKRAFLSPVKDRLEDVEEKAERADNRAEQHHFVLFGDPDDPNQTGLAEDVADIKDTVERIDDTVNGHHSEDDD